MTRYTTHGKQVLDRGEHFADARDDAAANHIALALNTDDCLQQQALDLMTHGLSVAKIRAGEPPHRVDPTEFWKEPDIVQQLATARAGHIERMCEQAKAKGPGWRVFAGPPDYRQNPNTLAWSWCYDITMLPPGHTAPGTGHIYGPWE